MKSALFAIALLAPVCIFSQANPSQSSANDEISIRQVLNQQLVAWNRGDIQTFMQGYWQNDSVMFIGKSGINWGWKKTLDHYKTAYPDTTAMGKLTYEIVLVKQLSSEYYYVVGRWMLSRRIGDLGGYYDLLFRKINGRWLIVADHSS